MYVFVQNMYNYTMPPYIIHLHCHCGMLIHISSWLTHNNVHSQLFVLFGSLSASAEDPGGVSGMVWTRRGAD